MTQNQQRMAALANLEEATFETGRLLLYRVAAVAKHVRKSVANTE
jgi:hypothetical protein